MFNLIKIEFKKVIKTKYFIASILSMMLSPIASVVMMSLEPRGFVLGDFNKINLILLSIIATRTIFPLISMSLIKMGHGMDGLKSAFLTPVSRLQLITAKVLMAFLWMVGLVAGSAGLVIVTELLLFKEMAIIGIVVSSLPFYGLILLYALPLQVLAMLLALLFNNIMIPTMYFMGIIISGYILQLYDQTPYLPSVIPKYISSNLPLDRSMVIAFIISSLVGIISFLVLGYIVKNRDYIK